MATAGSGAGRDAGLDGAGGNPAGAPRARFKCHNGTLDCENSQILGFHSNTTMCWTCAKSEWSTLTKAQVEAKASECGLKLLKVPKAAAAPTQGRTNAPRLTKTTEVRRLCWRLGAHAVAASACV
jgi:hypothetical protein